ncbi:acyl carrier protein [Candidatus Kaiserbacteria bacterium]|nr:acyl carrier protein [Candidatus Kaiserbacteria bacterium]
MPRNADTELRDTVISLIAGTLKVPAADIRDSSKLADIAPDSIALFELLVRLEKELGRRVEYEEIAHIETVGDVITYVASLPNDQTAGPPAPETPA